MEWISVKDSEPDFYKEVLIYTKHKEMFVAKLLKGNYGWESLTSSDFIVTHWQPLPEPPLTTK